jgi:hypothetical protein
LLHLLAAVVGPERSRRPFVAVSALRGLSAAPVRLRQARENIEFVQENRESLRVFDLMPKCHGTKEITLGTGLLLARMGSNCDMALAANFET